VRNVVCLCLFVAVDINPYWWICYKRAWSPLLAYLAIRDWGITWSKCWQLEFQHHGAKTRICNVKAGWINCGSWIRGFHGSIYDIGIIWHLNGTPDKKQKQGKRENRSWHYTYLFHPPPPFWMFDQCEFQDPKTEILHHIKYKAIFLGHFPLHSPYVCTIYGRNLQ